MEIVNPTAATISLMCDSVPYTFKPRSVMTVSDEHGRHLMIRGGRVGLVEARFGDDLDQIRYVGLKARVAYYKQVLRQHERVNNEMTEKKWPLIPDSPAVKQAKLDLYAYEAALSKLESKLGSNADEHYKADLQRLLDDPTAPAQAPGPGPETTTSLDDLDLDGLRAAAQGVGIDVNPKWNTVTLKARIQEAMKATTEEALGHLERTDTPAHKGTAGSAPGPSPTMVPGSTPPIAVR